MITTSGNFVINYFKLWGPILADDIVFFQVQDKSCLLGLGRWPGEFRPNVSSPVLL